MDMVAIAKTRSNATDHVKSLFLGICKNARNSGLYHHYLWVELDGADAYKIGTLINTRAIRAGFSEK